jgi:hypothetical protein
MRASTLQIHIINGAKERGIKIAVFTSKWKRKKKAIRMTLFLYLEISTDYRNSSSYLMKLPMTTTLLLHKVVLNLKYNDLMQKVQRS